MCKEYWKFKLANVASAQYIYTINRIISDTKDQFLKWLRRSRGTMWPVALIARSWRPRERNNLLSRLPVARRLWNVECSVMRAALFVSNSNTRRIIRENKSAFWALLTLNEQRRGIVSCWIDKPNALQRYDPGFAASRISKNSLCVIEPRRLRTAATGSATLSDG